MIGSCLQITSNNSKMSKGNIMLADKSIIDLIQKRESSRTYQEKQIAYETLQKVADYIAACNREITIKAKFSIIDILQKNQNSRKLGTYGIISGAGTFIAGVMDESETDAVTFGYYFEKIILFATALSLQTCWLGGTFKRNDFAQNMDIKENEYIAIVSPLGYSKDKKRGIESLMRNMAGSDKRKSWDQLFFEESISFMLHLFVFFLRVYKSHLNKNNAKLLP